MNRKFLAAAVFSAAMMLGSSGAMAGGGVRVGVGIGIGIPAYRPYPYYGYPYPYPYYYPYPVRVSVLSTADSRLCAAAPWVRTTGAGLLPTRAGNDAGACRYTARPGLSPIAATPQPALPLATQTSSAYPLPPPDPTPVPSQVSKE